MPENIEKNGLPFHVNGSFGLRDDRSDFKWPTHDNRLDEAAQWNKLMVDEVLNLTLIQMIDHAKSVINSDIAIDNFYSLFPRQNDIGLNWREDYLRPYFNELNRTELILNQNDRWIHIKDAFLTNKIDEAINSFVQSNHLDSQTKQTLSNCVLKLFDEDKLSKIPTPQHILDIYDTLANLKFIEVESVCQRLVNFDMSLFSSTEKSTMLDFLLQSVEDLNELNQIELLKLAKNKKWIKFGAQEQQVYLYDFAQDESLREFFFSSTHLQAILFDYDSLSNKSKHKLADLLTTNRQIIKYDNSAHFRLFAEKKLEEIQQSSETIRQLWRFVCKYFNWRLAMFADLKAVPFEYQRKMNHFRLNQSNSDALIKFFAINKQNAYVSDEVVAFFMENGVQVDRNHNLSGCFLFKDLYGLENHAQIEEYIPQFSLIDALVHLDKCLSKFNKSMPGLINEKMNARTKSLLINDLSTAIRIEKSKLTANFESLLSERLPIFQLYSRNESTISARECSGKLISCKARSDKLPIDPGLKLIDLSVNESNSNLVEYLKLAEFSLKDLLKASLNYFLTRDDLSNVKQLIEYVLKNELTDGVDLFQIGVFNTKKDSHAIC